MVARATILDRAAELLAGSASGDISTRAVCEAAGVTQPVLYRHFGDKDGLLSAIADHVWEQYLENKRAAERGGDPVADLRAGWDDHTEFALEHPYAYRLVFGAALAAEPAAIAEAMRLLGGVTTRLAAAGLLSTTPDEAARIVMAANSGVALGMILRPHAFPAGASETVREATLRGILVAPAEGDPAGAAAATLRARAADGGALTPAEGVLFDEWLERLTATRHPHRASRRQETP